MYKYTLYYHEVNIVGRKVSSDTIDIMAENLLEALDIYSDNCKSNWRLDDYRRDGKEILWNVIHCDKDGRVSVIRKAIAESEAFEVTHEIDRTFSEEYFG